MTSDALRGRFLWHELMTPDVPGATAFYTGLAGWGTMDWAGGTYTLLTPAGTGSWSEWTRRERCSRCTHGRCSSAGTTRQVLLGR